MLELKKHRLRKKILNPQNIPYSLLKLEMESLM